MLEVLEFSGLGGDQSLVLVVPEQQQYNTFRIIYSFNLPKPSSEGYLEMYVCLRYRAGGEQGCQHPASVPEHNVILLHLENSGVYLLILKMSTELCADSG